MMLCMPEHDYGLHTTAVCTSYNVPCVCVHSISSSYAPDCFILLLSDCIILLHSAVIFAFDLALAQGLKYRESLV